MALCHLPYYSPFASVASWNYSHHNRFPASDFVLAGVRMAMAIGTAETSCILHPEFAEPEITKGRAQNSSTYPNF